MKITKHNIHKNSNISNFKYGIIIWGDTCNSGGVFTLQAKVIRIMADVPHTTSCGNLLKRLEILPLSFRYILSLTYLNSLPIIRKIFTQIHPHTILTI